MQTSSAIIKTEHASRYLQQLCKHWGHKFAVEFDPAHGTIDFGQGQSVQLMAEEKELRVTLTQNPDGERNLEPIVEEHIKRFAFREELDFKWT